MMRCLQNRMRKRLRVWSRRGTLRATLSATAWLAVFAASAAGAVSATAKKDATASSSATLDARQIVDKTLAARGGIAAWSKIDSIIWVGHLESVRSPIPSLPFRLEQKRPNKSRFEINDPSQRSIRVFDGRAGWKMKNGEDGHPDIKRLTAQEVRFASQATGLEGALIDYRTRGTALEFELEGTEQIDGRPTYRIGFAAASGDRQHVWIDAQTFLETRYDRAFGSSSAAGSVLVNYREYRVVEGLAVPSVIEISGSAGGKPDRMVIEKVALNPPLDDREFAGLGDPRGSGPTDVGSPLK